MTTTVPGLKPRSQNGWSGLYQDALFETDKDKVPQRIAEAESAIRARVDELAAVSSDHIEEDLLLDDALYALHALRNSASETQAA